MKKLIDFYADWCGPCKVQKPILEKFAKENGVELEFVNVDEKPEMALKFGVRGLPSIAFFENGEHKETFIGLHKEAQLKEKMKL